MQKHEFQVKVNFGSFQRQISAQLITAGKLDKKLLHYVSFIVHYVR